MLDYGRELRNLIFADVSKDVLETDEVWKSLQLDDLSRKLINNVRPPANKREMVLLFGYLEMARAIEYGILPELVERMLDYEHFEWVKAMLNFRSETFIRAAVDSQLGLYVALEVMDTLYSEKAFDGAVNALTKGSKSDDIKLLTIIGRLVNSNDLHPKIEQHSEILGQMIRQHGNHLDSKTKSLFTRVLLSDRARENTPKVQQSINPKM